MAFLGAYSTGTGPSAAITSATTTSIVGAPQAGYRHVILSIRVWNSDAVDASTVQVLSGSTVIDGGPCPAVYGSWFGDYTQNPMKCGEAQAISLKTLVAAEIWYAIRYTTERITG